MAAQPTHHMQVEADDGHDIVFACPEADCGRRFLLRRFPFFVLYRAYGGRIGRKTKIDLVPAHRPGEADCADHFRGFPADDHLNGRIHRRRRTCGKGGAWVHGRSGRPERLGEDGEYFAAHRRPRRRHGAEIR